MKKKPGKPVIMPEIHKLNSVDIQFVYINIHSFLSFTRLLEAELKNYFIYNRL